MSPKMTVLDIDPGDEAWSRREARHISVSMEELVRRLIREKRVLCERRAALRARPQPAVDRTQGLVH